MRQRFEARGIFRLPLEAFAETLAKCQPTPAFGKIELRVEQLYHQTVRQSLPPCISFCFRFGPLYGRQALAQVVGKFNHAHGIVACKIGNIAHCFIFLGRDDFSDGLNMPQSRLKAGSVGLERFRANGQRDAAGYCGGSAFMQTGRKFPSANF